MSACTVKGAMLSDDLVHQEPIGFQVQFPAVLPCAPQRMILVLRRQWSFRKQKADGGLQFLHVFSALPAFFDITPKLRGVDG